MSITGAGILFTDGESVLAGFHPSRAAWSGIGGKCEDDEPILRTAIRETCEEIFGIKPEEAVLEEIASVLSLEEPVIRGDYAQFILCLDGLFTISEMLEKNGYTSQFYPFFPKVLSVLLEQRSVPDTAEIHELLWFPLNELDKTSEVLAPEFYKDLLEFRSRPSNA